MKPTTRLITLSLALAVGVASTAEAQQRLTSRPPVSVFRAGSIELHAFTGYAILSDDINLGVDEVAPNYTDNVPGSAPLTGLRLGYNFTEVVGAELEFKQSRTAFRRDNHGVTVAGLRANALGHIAFLSNTLRPFLLVGVGFEKLLQTKSVQGDPLDKADADLDPALYAGVGAKYHVTDRLSFRADGRMILAENQGGSSLAPVGYELMLGGAINLFLIDQDPDGDGIPTSQDRCPTQPEDLDGFEDEDGCPESDNDQDGIADNLDKCPLEKENWNKVDDDDGCPDQDSDGDLIEDRVDKCPHEPEDRDGFEDDDGCPETDNDKDGLLDKDDKCPNDAEDKDGYMDEDGCPDPDNDGDGIFDAADKCPDQLETHNGFDDDDGCPDTVPKKVASEFRGRIEGIIFALDSADIDKVSEQVLGRALKVLLDYPGVKIEIAGHTDNTGTSEHNMELSIQRATAVKAWFTKRAIDPQRMSAVGHGRGRPVAPNTSEAGRAKNRRIEFILLIRKQD